MKEPIEMVFDDRIKNHQWEKAKDDYEKLNEKEKSKKEMVILGLLLKVAEMEEKITGVEKSGCLFFRKDCRNLKELIALYYKVKYCLRRIEYGIEPNEGIELVETEISSYFLLMMISLFASDKKKVARDVLEYYKGVKDCRMDIALQKFLVSVA
ncbi:MAG: hypothetical protein ACOCNC_02595 [Acetivibrio ethanolgignens]